MPLMCVVYGLNYLDKTTLSYASIMGIKKDINLVGDGMTSLSPEDCPVLLSVALVVLSTMAEANEDPKTTSGSRACFTSDTLHGNTQRIDFCRDCHLRSTLLSALSAGARVWHYLRQCQTLVGPWLYGVCLPFTACVHTHAAQS